MAPVMIHYRHLLKWIESSYQLDQLSVCLDSIDQFRHTHRNNVAITLLADDLETICRTKHSDTAKIELANLKQSNHAG